MKAFLAKGPLLAYAYQYWGFHAKACYGEAGLPSVVSTFVVQWNGYPSPDGKISGSTEEMDLFKPCHIAAYFGLPDTLPASMNEWCNQV